MKKVIAVLIVLFVSVWFAFVGGKAKDSRFIAYNNGTVLDTQTKLMWAAKDNGKDINWEDAKAYCENYRGGGYTDWRMPTQDELAGLYNLRKTYSYQTKCGGEAYLTPLIELSCLYLWHQRHELTTQPTSISAMATMTGVASHMKAVVEYFRCVQANRVNQFSDQRCRNDIAPKPI
jgi:hypothetical protein